MSFIKVEVLSLSLLWTSPSRKYVVLVSGNYPTFLSMAKNGPCKSWRPRPTVQSDTEDEVSREKIKGTGGREKSNGIDGGEGDQQMSQDLNLI